MVFRIQSHYLKEQGYYIWNAFAGMVFRIQSDILFVMHAGKIFRIQNHYFREQGYYIWNAFAGRIFRIQDHYFIWNFIWNAHAGMIFRKPNTLLRREFHF